MQLKNTINGYGLISILLHWGIALTVFALLILGLWMVELNYYSPWYKAAPFWHKSIGITLAAVLIIRLIWRLGNPVPRSPAGHRRWEIGLAHLVHGLLYLLLLAIVVSGYLISTAKGQGISVFGWFELPALISDLPQQADIAGKAHYWLADDPARLRCSPCPGRAETPLYRPRLHAQAHAAPGVLSFSGEIA